MTLIVGARHQERVGSNDARWAFCTAQAGTKRLSAKLRSKRSSLSVDCGYSIICRAVSKLRNIARL